LAERFADAPADDARHDVGGGADDLGDDDRPVRIALGAVE
jgi:hypothetical protein